MRWKRTLQLVDVHCEGEIGRVVTGGLVDIPGDTMAAKLDHINSVDDSLRRFLTCEPRNGPAGSIVLLPPATTPDADVGLIILQSDQAHAMSGSNSMCAVTALLETGMIEMREPETTVIFDTAVGLVKAVATCRDGRCVSVSLDMPPAYVERLDDVIATEAWGDVRFDIAFRGIFYALVDAAPLGLSLEAPHARTLAMAGVEILEEINRNTTVQHPRVPEVSGIAYLMFRDVDESGGLRTCTTLKPGRVDRSPCGTGSNSNLAVSYARGAMKIGDTRISHSVIGSQFETQIVDVLEIDGKTHVANKVTGRCWVYGLSQIGLDPADPFPEGFRVADTWGTAL